jgi:hypothetical protein
VADCQVYGPTEGEGPVKWRVVEEVGLAVLGVVLN